MDMELQYLCKHCNEFFLPLIFIFPLLAFCAYRLKCQTSVARAVTSERGPWFKSGLGISVWRCRVLSACHVMRSPKHIDDIVTTVIFLSENMLLIIPCSCILQEQPRRLPQMKESRCLLTPQRATLADISNSFWASLDSQGERESSFLERQHTFETLSPRESNKQVRCLLLSASKQARDSATASLNKST